MKKRVSLLLLPLLATAALSQDNPGDEELPEVRRYTVEMIIFAYAQSVSAGTEIFPPDLPQPEPVMDDTRLGQGQDNTNSIESVPEIVAVPDAGDGLEEDNELADRPYELVMLAEDDFGLIQTYSHLQRLDAYEPLMHFGWTQPAYPDEDLLARPLSSFATPPDGLEGELTLYLSRYLHLAIKLQLDASFNDGPVDARNASLRGSFGGNYFGGEPPVSYPVRYRIDEDRIFRNGELRYFDHPKFGVLARITRVDEERTEDGERFDDMEMLGD